MKKFLTGVFHKFYTVISLGLNGELFDNLLSQTTDTQWPRRKQKWEEHYAKSKLIRDRLSGGIKLDLNPREQLSESIYFRRFEPSEQIFIKKYLCPGDIFVDIGANIGIFSLIAAKAVGKSGKVYAFEPGSESFTYLLHNVNLNNLKNVNCLQLALSDQEEKRIMKISANGFGAWNSFGTPSAGSEYKSTQVKCTTWDIFAFQHSLEDKVKLMKIDVEGWELRVLLGAEKELRRKSAPHLLIEFTEENAIGAGTSCTKIYRMLETFGYKIYSWDIHNTQIHPHYLQEKYIYTNLIASKRIEEICQRIGCTITEQLC